MNGTGEILDRINNLISDESKVLEAYNEKINNTQDSKNKAEDEKKSFEKNIKDIQKDIDDISKASELSERFANIDTFTPGLEKLGESLTLIDNLKQELKKIPERIEELENNIKELTDKVSDSSNVIKNAEEELSKLDVQLSDAKRYQENLIELIDLAKSGSINKTRDEVVETLLHVGFEEKDAISAAKIILFPEDDLIPYFNKKSNVVSEDEAFANVTPSEENVNNNESSLKEIEQDFDNIFNNGEVNEDFKNFDDVIDTDESNDIVLNSDDNEDLTPVDVEPVKDLKAIRDLLKENKYDESKFSDDDFYENEDTIKNNIKFIEDNNLDKEFVYKYPNIISDSLLKNKYDLIINKFGKTANDIKLKPEILASYSLDDLEKLIEVSTKNGVDPKLIPISVYLKGLQPFLRNYLELKENHIDLADDVISKFAAILAINPVDFKNSLQTLLDYNVMINKNDGKVALMNLTLSPIDLVNRMDMIINIGEEDIIKYYPEVLYGDVKGLVNRLLFLQRSDIPYKTVSHNKTIYQSFVLKQGILEKVLEKKVELNEILDKNDSNKIAKKIINDDELMDELDKIDDNFELANNKYLDDYKDVMKIIKGKYKETNNSYTISGVSFSKNKVNRDINYLVSIYSDTPKELILLASLFHNSRLSEDNMNLVIDVLNLKVR